MVPRPGRQEHDELRVLGREDHRSPARRHHHGNGEHGRRADQRRGRRRRERHHHRRRRQREHDEAGARRARRPGEEGNRVRPLDARDDGRGRPERRGEGRQSPLCCIVRSESAEVARSPAAGTAEDVGSEYDPALLRRVLTIVRLNGALAIIAACLTNLAPALAQKPGPGATRRDSIRDSILVNELTAGEADNEPLRRSLLTRPEWNLGFTTLHVGAGLLFDVAAYSQDSVAKEQFPDLNAEFKLRDFRFLLGGRFKTKRPFTWQAGIMYDAANSKWLVRQTGLMVAVPEIYSHFFIGRAKEGFSLNKVMVGYDGWSMERLPFGDATIPLLADGIKWLGYVPTSHLFWNLGAFMDALSEGQSFSSYNYQFAARGGWVPLAGDTAGTLLHIGMNFRIGDINNDTLQLRSKPEAFPAPYFIDTK